MSSLDDKPFPKGALLGAGLLVLTTVAGVGTIQLQKHFTHDGRGGPAMAAAPLQVRALRFVDQQDGVSIYGGHVRVFDAASGAELPQLRERDGFVRAVLNSLTSPSSQRSYDHAIREFIDWYCSEPRFAFNKTVVTPE